MALFLSGPFQSFRSRAADAPLNPVQEAYSRTRTNYLAHRSDPAAGIAFARACADWADYATSKNDRSFIAQAGIDAAHAAMEAGATNGAAHFYLALNIGQLAQTKTFGALSLVKDMERELLKAISLDPSLDHGGPDRSIAMLYRDTPGRPFSIGSKSKARQHLEAALKIAPDYPDNLLTAMESYKKWDEPEALRKLETEYERVLPEARKKFSGLEFAQAWRDWDERWRVLREK